MKNLLTMMIVATVFQGSMAFAKGGLEDSSNAKATAKILGCAEDGETFGSDKAFKFLSTINTLGPTTALFDLIANDTASCRDVEVIIDALSSVAQASLSTEAPSADKGQALRNSKATTRQLSCASPNGPYSMSDLLEYKSVLVSKGVSNMDKISNETIKLKGNCREHALAVKAVISLK